VDFELTDEQEELRASVRDVLARECPISSVRRRVEEGTSPEQPWRSAAVLGWPGLAVPERFGGLGARFTSLGLAIEEHGRVVAPGPFLPTTTQLAPLIREAGSAEQQERFLPALAAGERTGTLAVAGTHGGVPPGDTSLRARRDGETWVLSGERHHVFEADAVDEIGVVAHVDQGDGVALFVLPREALTISPIQALDQSRSLCRIDFDGLRVPSERVLGAPGAAATPLARTLEEATVALAHEMVGTCQTILDLTVRYARQREQFGRPIGTFQAVQHKLADGFGAIEKARATARFAAMTIEEDDPRRSLAASMAKVAAGECQRRVTQDGIQIHGGTGFTWEQDLHLYVKRAKSGEALFGTSHEHRARIADALGI
jgi:alkylation response protein AidB-like acyl-CoA dehydrogenase